MKKLTALFVALGIAGALAGNAYAGQSNQSSIQLSNGQPTDNGITINNSPPRLSQSHDFQMCNSGGEWCEIDRDCCYGYICVATDTEGKRECRSE